MKSGRLSRPCWMRAVPHLKVVLSFKIEKFNFLRDFGGFGFSGFVLEVLSADVFGSVEPPMNGLPCCVKELCDAIDCQAFLYKLVEGSSYVGRQSHTIHPQSTYAT